MVVVDLSGSMKTRGGADRYTSLFEWLAEHTKSDDRIGVVAMGYGARLVAPLTPKSELDMESMKPGLKDREKFTDVAAGLESAFYQLRMNESPEREKVILLYSDAQIDMPGGDWDERDAKRYLLEQLNSDMKEKQIRFIGVVPDGLKANFRLLHELAGHTGGMYFRGIPKDGAALLPRFEETSTVTPPSTSETIEPRARTPIPATTPEPPPAAAPAPPPLQVSNAKTAVTDVPESQTPNWIIILTIMFGIAVLGMFGIVLYLFTKQGRRPPQEIEALSQVLDDVHNLKQMTSKRRVSSTAAPAFDAMDTGQEEDEPDFGEPKDAISVSLVSPFLDYPERLSTEPADVMGQLTETSAMSDDDNFSISNMETLLGAEPVNTEEQDSK